MKIAPRITLYLFALLLLALFFFYPLHRYVLEYALFFSGTCMGLAIIIGRFDYFKVHYIRAVVLLLFSTICHYVAVSVHNHLGNRIMNYIIENYSMKGEAGPAGDFEVYKLLGGNLVAVVIFLTGTYFLMHFKKSFLLWAFLTSIVM